MKTKQLFTAAGAARTICSALFAGALLLSSSLFAQVKIGNNPTVIGATNNLEVEATNNKKVLIRKADGTMVIQNTPMGNKTDKNLTVDSSGNVRAMPPVTSIQNSVIRATLTTEINVGACPNFISVGGYFTSASCSLYAQKTIIAVTFPDLGTVDYDVFSTNNWTGSTDSGADLGNDILMPLIYDKTSTSFKIFLEETSATTIATNFSFIIVK